MASYLFDKLNYSGFKNIPGAVYTRSGVEYQQNAEGVWVPFDDDVPPRSDGVGVDVWQGAANILPQSNGLNTGSWSAVNATVAASAQLGPDNSLPAFLITSTSALGNRVQSSGGGVTVVAATTYAMSFFLAQGTARYGGIVAGNQASAGAIFDLQAGTVGPTAGATVVSSSISAGPTIGGVKFWRCTLVFTTTGTTVQVGAGVSDGATFFAGVYPSASSGDIYASFAQLETGSVATPPIKTTNAAATRGNPSMYINAPGLLVPPFAVQVWAQLPAIDGVLRRLLDIDDGNGNNRVAIFRSNANNGSIAEWASGVNATGTDFTGKTGARLLKVAARVRPTSYRAACDGALGSEVSTSAMQQMSRIVFGNTLVGGTAYLNGSIQRFQIINRDISDTELVSLTV